MVRGFDHIVGPNLQHIAFILVLVKASANITGLF